MTRRRIDSFLAFIVAMAFLPIAVNAELKQQIPNSTNPPTVQTKTESGDALEAARKLYNARQFEAAADAYNNIIQSDPKSALAYAGLAHTYLRLKRPADAYAAAEKAKQLGPNLNAVHVALGEVLFRQGKIADAEKEFTPLVNAGTKEARAYLGLYRLYWAASFRKHAKLAIDRAHALDPADPDIAISWISTLSKAERLKALQAYLAQAPADSSDQARWAASEIEIIKSEAAADSPPCRPVNSPGSIETPLEPLLYDARRLRGYGLKVNLNGVNSKLLLDTGASGILIDRKVAEKAGIKPLAFTQVGGIGDKGERGGYIGFAESIEVAGLQFKGCYVRVADQNSIVDEQGLIGGDFFSSYLVDINLPDAKLKLSPLPALPPDKTSEGETAGYHDRYVAPEMRTFSPVFRFGHMLLIETKLNDQPARLFGIDTGAFDNTISPDIAREVTHVSSDSYMNVKGISGKVEKVFRADNVTIQFGYLRQKNQDMVAFDTGGISDSLGTEMSGLLGFGMLRMLDIRIDYRDGLVDFEFNRNRFH